MAMDEDNKANTMVFNEEKKKEIVSQLQKYLNIISEIRPEIPQIEIDGIYGPQTQDAVKEFCKSYDDLPQNGEVNEEVWKKVVEVYNEVSSDIIKPVAIFPSIEYVMYPGDNNMFVSVLQVMLQSLGLQYRNCPMVDVTGIYDPLTISAIKNIQRIAEIDETGNVDLFTWNKIATLFNELQLTNLHLPQIIV